MIIIILRRIKITSWIDRKCNELVLAEANEISPLINLIGRIRKGKYYQHNHFVKNISQGKVVAKNQDDRVPPVSITWERTSIYCRTVSWKRRLIRYDDEVLEFVKCRCSRARVCQRFSARVPLFFQRFFPPRRWLLHLGRINPVTTFQ